MSWKFWEKKSGGTKVKKMPRPKELPSSVGRFLVVNLKQDPDWVWSLRCVVRQREGKKTTFDVRVFDLNDADAKGVKARDYDSFEGHPEAILFEGWFDKSTYQAELHRCKPVDQKGAA